MPLEQNTIGSLGSPDSWFWDDEKTMDRVMGLGVLPVTRAAISSLPDPTARSGTSRLSPLPITPSRAELTDKSSVDLCVGSGLNFVIPVVLDSRAQPINDPQCDRLVSDNVRMLM